AARPGGEATVAPRGRGRSDGPPPAPASLLVAREPVVVAVHPTHPLADRGRIPLRALQAEPMVTLTRASKLRATLETACHAAGFAPRIAAETSALGVVAEPAAVQRGLAP